MYQRIEKIMKDQEEILEKRRQLILKNHEFMIQIFTKQIEAKFEGEERETLLRQLHSLEIPEELKTKIKIE